MIDKDVPIAITDSNEEESYDSIANKMFNLDGYTKETVSGILKSKGDRNENISLSYLRLVDFTNLDLVEAYRKLILYVIITGDSQNVDLIHQRFCKIFSEQNASIYTTAQCYTLVTAFIILNGDLHSKKVPNKMTCDDFISNIQHSYARLEFEPNSLKAIYKSIKQKEIKLKNEMVQQRKRSFGNDTEKNTEVKKTKNDVDSMSMTATTSQSNNVPETENIRNFGFQILKVRISGYSPFQLFEKKSWKLYFGSINNLTLALYNYNDFKSFYEDKINNSPSQVELNEVGWQFIRSREPVEALPLHHSLAERVVGDGRKCELTLIDNSRYLLKVPKGVNIEKWTHCLNQASSLQSRLPLWNVQGDNNIRTIVHHKWSSEISKLSLADQLVKTKSQMLMFESDLLYLQENSSRKSEYKANLKYVTSSLNRYTIYHRTLDMMNDMACRTNQSATNENTNHEYLTATNWLTPNNLEASTSSSIHINSSSRMPMTSISEITSIIDDETET